VERFPTRAQEAVRRRCRDLGGGDREFAAALRRVLADPDWHLDRSISRHLQKPLRDIAHAYLSSERDRRGRPLNPVANFHLGNGATIAHKNVNFGANVSARGIDESCSLMVNYIYSRTTFQQLGSTVRSWLPWGRSGG
jgi:malonyl-CoA decarboxylase